MAEQPISRSHSSGGPSSTRVPVELVHRDLSKMKCDKASALSASFAEMPKAVVEEFLGYGSIRQRPR